MKVNTQQRAKLIEADDKPDAIAINVDAGNVLFFAPPPPPLALHFVINILFEVICCCCACY